MAFGCLPGRADDTADFVRACAQYSHGDYQGTTEILTRLVGGSYRDDAKAHYYLGNALLGLGKIDEARQQYSMALRLPASAELKQYCSTAMDKTQGGQRNDKQSPGAVGAARSSGTPIGSSSPAAASTTSAAAENTTDSYVGMFVVKDVIRKMVKGSPAEAAGLRLDDKLIAIDGKSTYGHTDVEILSMLRGKPGTKIRVDVERQGAHGLFTVTRTSLTELSKNMTESEKVAYAAKGVAPQLTRSGLQPDAVDKRLIAIQRHTADTDAIYDQVVAALNVVPKSVKLDLANYGVKILITPTIIEANPSFATEKPRGYIHGGGYDNCPGLYNNGTKDLYIAERAAWKNSPPQLNRWVLSTSLHELGHAYDYCKGHLSSSDAFIKAYEEDSGRLNNSQRTEFNYFLQEAGAGPTELFAELFALSQSKAGGIDERSPDLGRAFRKSFEYVRSLSYD
jgi:PDZ domain